MSRHKCCSRSSSSSSCSSRTHCSQHRQCSRRHDSCRRCSSSHCSQHRRCSRRSDSYRKCNSSSLHSPSSTCRWFGCPCSQCRCACQCQPLRTGRLPLRRWRGWRRRPAPRNPKGLWTRSGRVGRARGVLPGVPRRTRPHRWPLGVNCLPRRWRSRCRRLGLPNGRNHRWVQPCTALVNATHVRIIGKIGVARSAPCATIATCAPRASFGAGRKTRPPS
mmetsp:Transcript_3003/g.9086  ORF Transcript_3003/g.9086 Transcript_3003/m.9086 type:complete len:219 (+) Transcript_3003:260-916(+)